MQRKLLTLSVLALIAPLTPLAQANTVTVNFTNLVLNGFEFETVSPSTDGFGIGPFSGTLTNVSINATLNASFAYTYANDLTIYVSPSLTTGGLLQVGGFSNLSAHERHSWANGNSSDPGTTVIDSVALITPLTFGGGAADPTIYLGNGYDARNTIASWTGSVTLTYTPLPITPAVPEPSTVVLMLVGGAGLAAWTARRRRAKG